MVNDTTTQEERESLIDIHVSSDEYVTVIEKPPVVQFYEYYSERMHFLMKADPNDLAVIAEVGEIVDVFTPASKAFTRLDEQLKAKVNEVAKANNYEAWETQYHNITPSRTSVPTLLCLEDDEYKKVLSAISDTETLLKQLRAKQKEIESRPGYSNVEIKGYSRRERKP